LSGLSRYPTDIVYYKLLKNSIKSQVSGIKYLLCLAACY